MTSIRNRKKLRSRAYAHAYAEQLQDLLLATQLRVLRKQRKLSQQQLARLAHTKQARISLMESGSYSQWSLATLRALARAFDVGLDVRFVSYSALVARMEQETPATLEVEKRSVELTSSPVVVGKSTVKDVAPDDFASAVVETNSDWLLQPPTTATVPAPLLN